MTPTEWAAALFLTGATVEAISQWWRITHDRRWWDQ